jgi:hypothetical protein
VAGRGAAVEVGTVPWMPPVGEGVGEDMPPPVPDVDAPRVGTGVGEDMPPVAPCPAGTGAAVTRRVGVGVGVGDVVGTAVAAPWAAVPWDTAADGECDVAAVAAAGAGEPEQPVSASPAATPRPVIHSAVPAAADCVRIIVLLGVN